MDATTGHTASITNNLQEQYRVVRSRPRVYRSTINLKNLYIFNAFLLSVSSVIAVIPVALLVLFAIDSKSTSFLRWLASFSLAFFAPILIASLAALSLNLLLIYLLSLGIRKDYPLLTGSVSFLTAAGHTLMIASVVLCLAILSAQFYELDSLESLTQLIHTTATAHPKLTVLAVLLQILVIMYSLAFVVNGRGGFAEAQVETPLSTFFPSGIITESARKEDKKRLEEIHYANKRGGSHGMNSYQLWRSLMRGVKLERDVRIARVEDRIVGFLITSKNFRKVVSVHLSGEAIAAEAEECLLRDFVRLYSLSESYVDFVEVSSTDEKLQKALSQNGWRTVESEVEPQQGRNNRDRSKVSFRYVGETH